MRLPSEVETPASLGYRMPAEWERHESTWIAWPHNHNDWPGKFETIPWVYAEIVRHLSRVEKVHIVVNSSSLRNSARTVLKHAGIGLQNIKFHLWPTNRVWMRDSGPIFVRRKSAVDSLAATSWRFNAWAKYPDWKLDNQMPDRVARTLGLKQFRPFVRIQGTQRNVVLEGGSIDVNGQGLMLTTEECLLSKVQARNPGASRQSLEAIFAAYLGIEKVIWLGRGIVGDDTHGHVDDIARFVAPGTVLIATEQDRRDANYALLKENRQRLAKATGVEGRRLHVIDLPLPRPLVFRRRRLPASYANFYIANNLVLVPTFNDPQDRVALDILAEAFPRREVVGIYCGDFIWGLGAIHCVTQQQPA